MPTYVYQIINEDGSEGETFELVQRMADAPLEKHPQTGQTVRRVIQPPRIAGRWTESGTKKALSDSNLERLGFTKYEKSGKGVYEKRAGSGPAKIDAG
jgi:predicted nucleic acid-binding Zn ribbon protein